MNDEELPESYAQDVGQRLRSIRRQQGLSLQAVEQQSGREFKASVLGAYERGERVISVLRLQRLAALYSIPVDQLLPRNGIPGFVPVTEETTSDSDSGPVTLDLVSLESLQAPERDVIRRYVGMIQIQRGDYNGKMITVRTEDVRALARVFERDEMDMRNRLRELGIIHN